jgi:hypothetical protein
VGRRRQRIGRRLVGAHGHEIENGKPHGFHNAASPASVP